MSLTIGTETTEILYLDSNGQPMADNTKWLDWSALLRSNVHTFRPKASVSGDLFWYPEESKNKVGQAPDVLIAIGRPKGHYRGWTDGNVALQVVFEVLRPGNRANEMQQKLEFLNSQGVEEYYLYDPDSFHLSVWIRNSDTLRLEDPIDGFISPLLKIRFDAPGDRDMVVYRPDGPPFETSQELRQALADAEAKNEMLRARLREREG